MRNIYLLPTDKETRLFTSDSELILAGYPATTFKTGKNIYITSDEKPKLNDWFLDTLDKVVFKVTEEDILTMELDGLPFNFKKIILTTDQDLIKDGVQAIDDEFLEWFVKNQSCEEVEVNDLYRYTNENTEHIGYKIIIPKEEPKQETLEEAAERFYPPKTTDLICSPKLVRDAYIAGAKWQAKRMYREEDMKEAFEDGKEDVDYCQVLGFVSKLTTEEWFEQFKNK